MNFMRLFKAFLKINFNLKMIEKRLSYFFPTNIGGGKFLKPSVIQHLRVKHQCSG